MTTENTKPESAPVEPINRHVMLDLETMGNKPFAPVVAIGAVRFDMGTPARNDASMAADMFYQTITLESCMEIGLKPDASTILWWLEQSDAARAMFKDPSALPLPQVLDMFTDWLNSRPDKLWGNSARFDCGILEAAYRACGKIVPWEHWNERCYRTIKSTPMAKEIKLVRTGVHHNALFDAVSQANHLVAIDQALGLGL